MTDAFLLLGLIAGTGLIMQGLHLAEIEELKRSLVGNSDTPQANTSDVAKENTNGTN